MRQAFAGMLWSKQFFNYDVARWLDGDPAQPPPPPGRAAGRNHEWRHLHAHDVISMPDKWEYPWFAAWDLAFHTVALAHVDPEFAKEQLVLMCREWYMHPNGGIPAYEWAFSDVNPPVHAWAALRVFRIDGSRDRLFLERIFQKLLLSFAWWTNRKDEDGDFLFAGGFLGLDNIGPFDRSAPLPPGVRLEQADGTGWMAIFALNMLEMALVLAAEDPAYEDMAIKFFVHFGLIARALATQGLWDEEDGFLYDRLARPADGTTLTVRARSMTGLIPLCAVAVGHGEVRALPRLWPMVEAALRAPARPVPLRPPAARTGSGGIVSVLDEDRLRRVLSRVLDEGEFLSPYGLRALSAAYRDHPYQLELDGRTIGTLEYEPAESRSGMFGGNSNWRGPVWFPVNYLVIEALDRYGDFFGDALTVEHPTGSGRQATLTEVADDLRRRLVDDLPARRAGSAAVLRRRAALPGRPVVARRAAVQRVLPRRPRLRARRLAPDRVDGARGRPDRDAGGGAGVTPAAGRQVLGDLAASAAREWLVADGLGGFAMGTAGGLEARRYHGLLCVSAGSPGRRMMGLVALDPVLVRGDARVPLATHEWADGTVAPAGHVHLEAFAVEDGVPCWRWRVGDVVHRAAGRDGARAAGGGGGAPPGARRRAGAAGAGAALHVARRPRRAHRPGAARRRGGGRRVRVRGRVPRRGARLDAGRRLVPGAAAPRGGGPRPAGPWRTCGAPGGSPPSCGRARRPR